MNEKTQSALREEKILSFWKKNEIFKKSLKKSSPKGEYIFYEGPPTANGKPGIHHLEARAFKDVIPRYKTMRGYYVRRKGGWDTHGLPVELQVEKKLNLSSKKEIEEYGIGKFNQECKKSVWEYLEFWNKFTERIGFWLDQDHPYVTYHNSYIESVWNIIKNVNNQGLLYKDYKVVPWCPRCGTVLSSHELAQGYENVKDLSIFAKFRIKENEYILAWTTTPWTLPGNVALAVGEKIDYVKIKVENEFYILAKDRLEIIEGEYKIIEEMKGKDLIGLEYEPLYPYLKNQVEKNVDKAFKVYPANFVTTEDGTGVVHTAVMYGQDDFILGTEIGLPKYHLVGLDGKFLSGTDFLAGRFVRDEEVAVDIIKDLHHRGLLLKKEKYEHSYPHCWRCKTALIYYARDSWYIKMSALKDKMVKENKSINWEPSYIKEGRFGEWLKDVKDWAISRERYWGTPLPIWSCNECKKIEVIGSINELKSRAKKSGNHYYIVRHGEADHNVQNVMNADINGKYYLTKKGKDQVEKLSKELKNIEFDYIFASPLIRTKETLNILKKELNLEGKIFFDDRIKEINSGVFEGKSIQEYSNFIHSHKKYFDVRPEGGESKNDVKRRVHKFFIEIENKYKNKNILVVSHGDPIWLMFVVANALTEKQAIKFAQNEYPRNADLKKLDFVELPHNENFELDLHRPYIDNVELICDCGNKLKRTPEVMDVWLDSGAMPFAQDHYPFDSDIKYPADFISEAIDQTRGWFYTLHAIGNLMNLGKSFKNVICLGHILDADGKKMSKSIGNVVDPWEMIDKYGVDTLRMWMYSVNQPGESKNFDEKTVKELNNKVFNLLYNVMSFYELYRDESIETDKVKSSHVLDKWILSLFNNLAKDVTSNLEDYKLLEPVRAIREFIDDLSTWYLRRSRDRIKEGDIQAKKTLYYILKNLSRLMAPFTPFSADDIWQKLRKEKDVESVHLASWPKSRKKKVKAIDQMNQVREIVTIGLKMRQKNNIPVRQPLSEIKVKELKKEYIDILKNELNIKEVIIDKNINNIELNTLLNEELKLEGQYRDFLRNVQKERKKSQLNPNDLIILSIKSGNEKILDKFKEDLKRSAGIKEIKIDDSLSQELSIKVI
ncbi:MAG: class I tRNA ligase family protein [Patescibacteria group bacterium]|nr:class I tRNA ligase family protein [Patescibacteria group bacterium]